MVQLPNFRKIDEKFYLSGGWSNLPQNIKFLQSKNVKAILDLQFLPEDVVWSANQQRGMIFYIKDELEKAEIEYKYIFMRDDELNNDFEDILIQGSTFLQQMEEKYPEKKEGILVKCAAGISRSPTLLINYLCESRRMNFYEGLNYVRKNEDRYGIGFGASPNYFFTEQLKKKYK